MNDITLTRGDTLYLKVNVRKDGEHYFPVEGDKFRFAMKRRYKDPDEEVLLVKDLELSDGGLFLRIAPEETKHLQMNRSYVYDIQYTDIDGDVYTFIKGKITLTEEVI